MTKKEINHEEVLIGLSMLAQVFSADFDRGLAQDIQNLYAGRETALLQAVVSAATLCMQRYAIDSEISEVSIIEQVREKILSGEMRLN